MSKPIDKEREVFELQARENRESIAIDEHGQYENPYVQSAWEGWQARAQQPAGVAVPGVERWDIGWGGMEASPIGDYVSWKDYEALLAADPSEVERLRAELELSHLSHKQTLQQLAGANERAFLASEAHVITMGKLIEAQALLGVMRSHEDEPSGYKYPVSCWFPQIDAFLSATATPAERKTRVPLNACTECKGADGFLIGHDSSKDKPHSIRCGGCYNEVHAKEHTGLADAWNSLNPKTSVSIETAEVKS